MKYLLLIFSLVILYSCTSGECCSIPPEPKDNIGLSSTELWFNVEGGVDSVTTEGENWHMTTLLIGDTVIFLQANEYYVRGEFEELRTYESGTILIDENGYEIGVETPWFNINKPESKKIIFSADKNETKKERNFSIRLVGHGSGYDIFINITQSAE